MILLDLIKEGDYMKNAKKCIKCDSKNIIRIPGNIGPYGSGNNIIASKMTTRIAVKVTRYLCSECGYSEEWIEDKSDIEKMVKYYK